MTATRILTIVTFTALLGTSNERVKTYNVSHEQAWPLPPQTAWDLIGQISTTKRELNENTCKGLNIFNETVKYFQHDANCSNEENREWAGNILNSLNKTIQNDSFEEGRTKLRFGIMKLLKMLMYSLVKSPCSNGLNSTKLGTDIINAIHLFHETKNASLVRDDSLKEGRTNLSVEIRHSLNKLMHLLVKLPCSDRLNSTKLGTEIVNAIHLFHEKKNASLVREWKIQKGKQEEQTNFTIHCILRWKLLEFDICSKI